MSKLIKNNELVIVGKDFITNGQWAARGKTAHKIIDKELPNVYLPDDKLIQRFQLQDKFVDCPNQEAHEVFDRFIGDRDKSGTLSQFKKTKYLYESGELVRVYKSGPIKIGLKERYVSAIEKIMRVPFYILDSYFDTTNNNYPILFFSDDLIVSTFTIREDL